MVRPSGSAAHLLFSSVGTPSLTPGLISRIARSR